MTVLWDDGNVRLVKSNGYYGLADVVYEIILNPEQAVDIANVLLFDQDTVTESKSDVWQQAAEEEKVVVFDYEKTPGQRQRRVVRPKSVEQVSNTIRLLQGIDGEANAFRAFREDKVRGPIHVMAF